MFSGKIMALCTVAAIAALSSTATASGDGRTDRSWNALATQHVALAMVHSGKGKYRHDDARNDDRGKKFDDRRKDRDRIKFDDDDRTGKKHGHFGKHSGKRGAFKNDDRGKGRKYGHYRKDSGERGRGKFDRDDDDNDRQRNRGRDRDRDRHRHKDRDREFEWWDD